MNSIQVPCKKCGQVIEIIPIGNFKVGLCDLCASAANDHLSEAKAVGQSRLAWEKISASFAAYRNTDFYRLPYPDRTSQAIGWNYGKKGLNLWGPPKCGKTRTLVMICQQLFEQGKKIRMFGSGDFVIKIQSKHFDAPAWLNQLRAMDALAFDDVGKSVMTPVQEGHWFGLIEYFCGVGKPILMTHNFTGEQLEKKLRHGEAIVARIREHFKSIYFGEPRTSAPGGQKGGSNPPGCPGSTPGAGTNKETKPTERTDNETTR